MNKTIIININGIVFPYRGGCLRDIKNYMTDVSVIL
jgi:hypothetical protein